jgi:hypothetical protein
VIGNRTRVSREIEPGRRVVYTSRQEPNGEEVVTQLEVVPDDLSGCEEVVQKYGRPACVVDEIERGTEYSLNLIPFGGYVRMLGEEDPSAPRSFASKSKRVRLAVLMAGAVMNLVLAVVVFCRHVYAGGARAGGDGQRDGFGRSQRVSGRSRWDCASGT